MWKILFGFNFIYKKLLKAFCSFIAVNSEANLEGWGAMLSFTNVTGSCLALERRSSIFPIYLLDPLS